MKVFSLEIWEGIQVYFAQSKWKSYDRSQNTQTSSSTFNLTSLSHSPPRQWSEQIRCQCLTESKVRPCLFICRSHYLLLAKKGVSEFTSLAFKMSSRGRNSIETFAVINSSHFAASMEYLPSFLKRVFESMGSTAPLVGYTLKASSVSRFAWVVVSNQDGGGFTRVHRK